MFLTSSFFRLVIIEEENDMDFSPKNMDDSPDRASSLSFPVKLSGLSLFPVSRR